MDKFNEEREVYLNQMYGNMTTETLDKNAREGVRTATPRSIPKSIGNAMREAVWLHDQCEEAVINIHMAF